ncbi:WD40-repeat-containing domain protein [Fimicolochytrium jonesii]|uniref:WD40-repeat-containing domain protein n=1 Tax=Fimicolochytrium jonesii TaxID=1396493 RepID=UPI0022FDC667|nr:WD40-repeat-containing domain protein [Fimicolochytrium jonesii]KAI8822158.1 WD40-repeat-containing domain protein [Fimicolochytrium jonesii]
MRELRAIPGSSKRVLLIHDPKGQISCKSRNSAQRRAETPGHFHSSSASADPANSNPPANRAPFLAEEILLLILSHVNDPGTLAKSAQVSRKWKRLLNDDVLWRSFCKDRNFEQISRSARSKISRIQRPLPLPGIWKKIYKHNYLTGENWKRGACKVSSITSADGDGRDLPMHFDDNWVVSVALGDVGKVWDIETGECHLRLNGHEGTISAVKFAHRWVVTGGIDSTLKVWDTQSGECVRTLIGHEGEIVAVECGDDVIVSGSEDMTVRVWSMETGECIEILTGHTNAVCCLQFDHENIISGSADHTIKIWTRNASSQSTPPAPTTLMGHDGHVYCLQLNSSHICSGSQDATIKLWRRSDGECLKTLKGHRAGVVCLQFDEKKLVSGSSDKSIKVWDLNSGTCLYTLSRHSETVWNLRFTPTKLITSSFDQSLLVWDFAFFDDEAEAGGRYDNIDSDGVEDDGNNMI